jgi:hypothetical protein
VSLHVLYLQSKCVRIQPVPPDYQPKKSVRCTSCEPQCSARQMRALLGFFAKVCDRPEAEAYKLVPAIYVKRGWRMRAYQLWGAFVTTVEQGVLGHWPADCSLPLHIGFLGDCRLLQHGCAAGRSLSRLNSGMHRLHAELNCAKPSGELN